MNEILSKYIYYQDEAGFVLHGDSRLLMQYITSDDVDVIVTDPVWPGCKPDFPGSDDPFRLFYNVAVHFPRLTDSVIIILGCNTDPRLLSGIHPTLKFLRLAIMERIPPSYRGPIMYSFDVAYVFGAGWLAKKKTKVLPAKCSNPSRGYRDHGIKHPCPRHPKDMIWLLEGYTRPDQIIFDPFAGSGMIAWAAKQTGRKYLSIEIEKDYCDDIVRRLSSTGWNRSFQETMI